MEQSTYKNGTLDRLRDSKNKREKYENFLENNYKTPFGVTVISNIIKKQNTYLLEWICKKKQLNNNEKGELFKNFLKINYFCSDIVSEKIFNHTYKK